MEKSKSSIFAELQLKLGEFRKQRSLSHEQGHLPAQMADFIPQDEEIVLFFDIKKEPLIQSDSPES